MVNDFYDTKLTPPKKAERDDTAVRIKRAIDILYTRQLTNILSVMIVYYSLITVMHYYFVAEGIRSALMFITSITALASTVVYMLIRQHLIWPSQSHYAFVPVGILGIAAVYLHVFLTGDQLQLTNGILLLFAFGFVTFSPFIFGFFFVANTALYLSVLLVVPGPNTAHFSFMYFAAAAMGVVCFVLRYRTIYSAQRLLIANRKKTSRLVQVSKIMQENMDKARIAAESAEKANKAKDAFLANTTHELRTPLTGVLGMMDILHETRLNEEQKEAVVAAQFSARTLLVIVNDLLDLAKIDAGTFALKTLPFSASMVVAYVCELLRPQAKEKGLFLNLTIADDKGISLIGDPVRVGQIVLNFVDNAIKFTEKGGVTVSVEMDSSTSRDECLLSISVRDTGPGFENDDWGRLFARFEQLDNSATRQAEGAGLGLAICQSLAHHMNGSIAVDSEPGVGSEFRFSAALPIAHDIDGVDLSFVSRPKALAKVQKPSMFALPSNEKVQPSEKLGHKPPCRILLAEDNRVNQLLVKKLASRFGWQLDIADNGEAAVRRVEEEQPYDLILMDIRMPVMDGVEAVRLIKKLPSFRSDIPIIALTANTAPDDVEIYKAAGMAVVIGKPIEAAKLKSEVDIIMASKAH